MKSARSTRAAVVLAGGHSRRMGRPKALLQIAGRPLLAWVTAPLRRACADVVVVAAHRSSDEECTALGALARTGGDGHSVRVVRDRIDDAGPVAGALAGMDATELPHVFLTACDSPLRTVAFVERIFELLENDPEAGAVIPTHLGRSQPLCAGYRRERARDLFADKAARDDWRLSDGLDDLSPVRPTHDDWRDIDPDDLALQNLNRPEDVARAERLLTRRTSSDHTRRRND